jgi:phosphoserine phosphatase RsbU/P
MSDDRFAVPDFGSEVLGRLLDLAHLATPQDLANVLLASVRPFRWTAVMYLVDLRQDVLVPVPPSGTAHREQLGIDATLAGRAYRNVQPVQGAEPGQVWVPLVDGVERLGVLDCVLPEDVSWDDPAVRDRLRWLAALTGHLIAVKSKYGDTLLRARRRHEVSLAAELTWQMLPPLTFGCEGLVLSAILEPAHEVAGDAFDYGVDDGMAGFSVLDAAGHSLSSGLLSAVALSAGRQARRGGRGLLATADQISEELMSHFGDEAFVTAFHAELELTSGRLRYLNAGHPEPLVLRQGKVVKALAGGRCLPLGMDSRELAVAEEWLEPGDWVVVYTDGVVEARDEAGAEFGVDRLVDFLDRSAADQLPAPETLRRSTHAVLAHQQDVLQDDATLLIVQWIPGQKPDLLPA